MDCTGIFDLIDSYEMKVSIYCKDLVKDKIIIDYNADIIHESASIIKILIMAEALRQSEEGIFNLCQNIKVKESDIVPFSVIEDLDIREFTYKDLITLMIAYSDNTATNVLIDLLGMDKINLLAKNLQLKNTILQRKMMDFQSIERGMDNHTTIMDTFEIFKVLKDNSLVGKELSELAYHILYTQKISDAFLRFVDKKDLVIFHKTGELAGLNHDVGIFQLGSELYFLGIFVSNGTSNWKNKEFIGKVSELIYRSFKNSLLQEV